MNENNNYISTTGITEEYAKQAEDFVNSVINQNEPVNTNVYSSTTGTSEEYAKQAEDFVNSIINPELETSKENDELNNRYSMSSPITLSMLIDKMDSKMIELYNQSVEATLIEEKKVQYFEAIEKVVINRLEEAKKIVVDYNTGESYISKELFREALNIINYNDNLKEIEKACEVYGFEKYQKISYTDLMQTHEKLIKEDVIYNSNADKLEYYAEVLENKIKKDEVDYKVWTAGLARTTSDNKEKVSIAKTINPNGADTVDNPIVPVEAKPIVPVSSNFEKVNKKIDKDKVKRILIGALAGAGLSLLVGSVPIVVTSAIILATGKFLKSQIKPENVIVSIENDENLKQKLNHKLHDFVLNGNLDKTLDFVKGAAIGAAATGIIETGIQHAMTNGDSGSSSISDVVNKAEANFSNLEVPTEPSNPYDSIQIGESIDSYNITEGYNSSNMAVDDVNVESLNSEYVNGENSEIGRFAILDDAGSVEQIISEEGVSASDLIDQGYNPDNIAIDVQNTSGESQAWTNIDQYTQGKSR